jgi:hypothetical protein
VHFETAAGWRRVVPALVLGAGAALVVVGLARARRADSPLRALLEALAAQIDALREELEQIYEDAFVETCTDP